MLYIKARYLKDGKPAGREYTFGSDVIVKPGDVVSYGSATLSVTDADVSESEVEAFKDKIKKIDGKVETNGEI